MWFLRFYFPKTLDISTGFIIDSNSNQSKQIDIIISYAARTPIFYENPSVRILPVECVYAVIEVKTMLDSTRLQQSFENMKSVRKLEKKAFSKVPPYDDFSVTLYDMSWPICPINYFVFAFDSMDLNDLECAMAKNIKKKTFQYIQD